MEYLERLGDWVWGPWLLGLFLGTGLYCSLRTGFFQIFGCRRWLKATIGALHRRENRQSRAGLTQFQALTTALASTIGTGSVAGVATAIFYGGPGAVFWMWVSAFLGMMTGCVEKTLAVRYRERGKDGTCQGGPMCYIERGTGSRFLALLFSACCLAASLGGGNVVQANSIAAALEASFGWNRLAVGIVVALFTGTVILGGVGRIGRLSEKLVPGMALLFLLGGCVVLCRHAGELPHALACIWSGAFSLPAAGGGAAGYGISAAMRYGIARGVFTNEAGIGSSAIAHAASDTSEPARQGMWGIFEVFISTILICSVTALVILTSGVYHQDTALDAIRNGTVSSDMTGASLAADAFGTVFGQLGGVFVSLCLLLFAFTSLLGWSYYGERSLEYLTGTSRGRGLYRLLFLLAIVWGSQGEVGAVWQMADIFNGLMSLPNLAALLLLSPEALHLLNIWLQAEQERERQQGRAFCRRGCS